MKSFRADHIERDDPVRVSDGSWLPAAVVEVVLERGRKFLIVRFEIGGSAGGRKASRP